jgi:hypothetical protein
MMLSRMHYEMIAGAIRSARNDHHQGEEGELAINCVVEELVEELSADNPKFDRTIFRTACARKEPSNGRAD